MLGDIDIIDNLLGSHHLDIYELLFNVICTKVVTKFDSQFVPGEYYQPQFGRGGGG